MFPITQRIALAVLMMMARTASSQPDSFGGSLENFLRSQGGAIGLVMQDPAQYRLQLVYTRIDRDALNAPIFTSYSFRLNQDEYFYPASTVKLPTSLLALQQLHSLSVAGVTIDTPMSVEPATPSEISRPAPQPKPAPSIGDDVRRILLVSDNDAYNRLYEFLGYHGLNQALQKLGLEGTRIVHRLEVALSEQDNRNSAAIRFHEGAHTLYQQPARESTDIYRAEQPVLLGQGELSSGTLIQGPKDFAGKNAYPLKAQHDLLVALLFPDAAGASRRLKLTAEDYRLVYRSMSATPAASGFPEYADREQYPDGYVKFLMYGGDEPDIPDNIRVFNKSGRAYGFLTDTAYIVDLERRVEFVLAATIYTNENGIFNDDVYEYDSIGFPFMRELGQAIFALELARERQVLPDLSRFDLR